MTEDEFFAKLSKTPRDWRLGEGDSIRRPLSHGLHACPVSACNGFPMDLQLYRYAATWMGLPPELSEAIVRAADNLAGHDPALRARLLSATGLEE